MIKRILSIQYKKRKEKKENNNKKRRFNPNSI